MDGKSMGPQDKKKKLDDKAQINLRNNIFFVASSLMIVATIILQNPLIIFSLFLLTILHLVHHSKANGNKAPKSFFKTIIAARRKKRIARLTEERMRVIRGKLYRPRNLILFVPLMICIVVLYLFLSHTIFFAVVTSDSMSPSFKTGDLLLMQGHGYDLEEDDIIMFKVDAVQELVIHRVDTISEDGILTRGDALDKTDKWIIAENDVQAEVLNFNDNPIVFKDAGWYFIDNAPADSSPFSEELQFTTLMMVTMKDIGLLIFILAVVLYLAFTVRDIRFSSAVRRR